jgi:hypothetical protein
MFTQAYCTIGGARCARVELSRLRRQVLYRSAWLEAPPAERVALPRLEARSGAELIEITLPDGTAIKVGHDVSLAALRRVVTALPG